MSVARMMSAEERILVGIAGTVPLRLAVVADAMMRVDGCDGEVPK